MRVHSDEGRGIAVRGAGGQRHACETDKSPPHRESDTSRAARFGWGGRSPLAEREKMGEGLRLGH
jgi:hypothetical protein